MTHLQTRAVGYSAPVPQGSRPAAVPIYQTSTFEFDDPDAAAAALRLPDRGYAYTRHSNPTTRALENAIADLEGGTAALATSSGMGAINAVLLALLRPGDHVIAQARLYGGTRSVLGRLADRFGIGVSYIAGDDQAELAEALRPRARVLYLETITNPTTQVANLPALLADGRAAGLTCVVDNTFATPVLCRPIEHGADVVVHSATKYLGGHDDVVAGLAVFADRDLHRRIWRFAVDLGVVADPFAAWLVLRGLKTLPLRMARHCENAGHLARFLDGHPEVTNVRWPGLPGQPDHELARRILDGFGGILCCDLAGGPQGARPFFGRLRCAAFAPSLGGPRTLVAHPASSSHRELDAGALRAAGIGEGTIRISAGIEHHEDLIADFEQALKP
ncbi:MAG TPA: aminotransferase class I/II-fold pyridoxal phosphate-dependent enzyme [Streptosporangiaceae bacterium]|nr:aminotransferase class I/II-fold pyridoxal phosphate-dependent enzyme [Streptosporangiaceae bacterium]